MSNKSRYTGSMWFRGRIKKPDTFSRKNTAIGSPVGSFAVRTLQALSNPRADGKPHRDTTTPKLKAKQAFFEALRRRLALTP